MAKHSGYALYLCDGDVVDVVAEVAPSSTLPSLRRPGLRRRRRRWASEPKAFLLPRQAGEGVAETRRGSGVRHVGAERWERAGDLEDCGVPRRRTACGALLNQQRDP